MLTQGPAAEVCSNEDLEATIGAPARSSRAR
jgi:hypothetical protein